LHTLRSIDASRIPTDPIGAKQLRAWFDQHLRGRRITIGGVVRNVEVTNYTLFHADDWDVRFRVDRLMLEEWSRSEGTAETRGGNRKRSWVLDVANKTSGRNHDFSFDVRGSDKVRAFQALADGK